MTYKEEAAAFDWREFDRYAGLFADGLGLRTAAIAARFGVTPCRVRRVLLDGKRLEGWRSGAGVL